LAQTYPKASLFLAGGAVVHEAGGSPALELGFAAAAAVAYAKALIGAGMDRREAFSRIVVGLSVDHEPLTTIAKLRAARVLWRRITSACDAETPARIEARSSNRMLTRADSWSNLVRLTASGFAAAVGGADAVALGCFSDAAGEPDDLALRMARNTQLILMEEAHVGAVVDPTAGAWSFETLTRDLAHAAWDAFTAIEAAGGVVSALTSGMIADKVAANRAALATTVSDGRRKIVGVTDFKSAEPPAEVAARRAHSALGPDISQPGADSHCRALTSVRLEEMAT
jgi:methylmalonyl-CoA mutase